MQQLPCMLLVVSVLSSACAPADAASMPLPGGHLRDWVIIGPFDNTARSGGRGAFDTDLLTALGGEAKARPKPGDAAGACVARAASIKTDVLNFTDYYPDSDYKIAYAFSEISAAASGEQFFFLGSDDGAKVWVNGELVFEVLPPEGRGIALRQDHFSAKLRKGNNSILVKVENLTGGWSLALEKVPEAVLREVVAQQKVERNRREFQHLEIAPGDWPGYVYWFENGGAPRIGWQNPERVRELVGDVPLTVRWFDSSLNEVQQPDKPGRYAAYIEGKLPDGTPVRRALTFYSAPREFEPWIDLRAAVPHLGKPADPEVGKALEAAGYRTLRNIFMDGLIGTQDGAMLVAAAFETKPGQVVTTTESPAVLNDDFQLALKLKLLGLDGKTRPLGPPKDRSSSPAPTLHEGTPAEAGVNPDAKEKIDAVCRAWAAESGEPLSTLVARHGVIITHSAFGKDYDDQPVTPDFRWELASITKAISGILFSLFLDQGYITLDEPIGNRLPGFPVTGPQALTYRHLFTHTCSLDGHGMWGGLQNPHLENVILNGLPYIRPGTTHAYNGMGYDLAGKAMEVMTGASIIRLFHEALYRPLGIPDVPMSDMGFSARMTSYELGVIGQWLANSGSYGDKQFISEDTFARLLPEQLGNHYPGLEIEWGIGLTWFRELQEGSTDPSDAKSLILGKRVIGHGSATSCILRVDLDHDLVIAQVRRTSGPDYETHLRKFLQTIADALR